MIPSVGVTLGAWKVRFFTLEAYQQLEETQVAKDCNLFPVADSLAPRMTRPLPSERRS